MNQVQKLKKLRDETGATIMECKKALAFTDYDYDKATAWLKEHQYTRPRSDKPNNSEGGVFSYVHNNRIGAMVQIHCNTDFVSRSDDFKHLGREIAMQLAAVPVKDTAALLDSEYIRDSKLTIGKLLNELAAKTRENIEVVKFTVFEVGQ